METTRERGEIAEAGTAPESELVLGHVEKRYGAVVAVDDVSFSVERGEFLTILGPSGSGKTTLLHMIAGFLFPDAGAIRYRGTNITFMPAHLRNMGMVSQNYALFPHMTVAQNLAFPLRMRRVRGSEAHRRVGETLDLVGLGARAWHLPSQLSGGQQQRVALARALVYGPSLLLMDEPLGALDKSLRERLQVEIKRIQRATGVTILSVTHDQQEALSMSDRIAVMTGGKLAGIGAARAIYERPPSRFVAEAIGACNFLPGHVLGREGGMLRVALGHGIAVGVPGVAGAAGRFAAGARATVCIRPEGIGVAERVADSETLAGTILEVVYLGDVIRYEVGVGDSSSPLRISAKVLRGRMAKVLDRGAVVSIGWENDDAWLIAEEGEHARTNGREGAGEDDDACISAGAPAASS